MKIRTVLSVNDWEHLSFVLLVRVECLIVFTVYTPINSGLAYVKERGIALLRRRGIENIIIEDKRAEEIPELIERELDDNVPVFGITGDDLLVDYLLEMGGTDERVFGREKDMLVTRLYVESMGPYAASIFGLSALCVLGRDGVPPSKSLGRIARYQRTFDLPELNGTTIAIPRRYENLVRREFRALDITEARLFPLDSQVEVTAARDATFDYAVNIVLTGKTCTRVGMGVLAVLYMSNGALLGNRAARIRLDLADKGNAYKSQTNGGGQQ